MKTKKTKKLKVSRCHFPFDYSPSHRCPAFLVNYPVRLLAADSMICNLFVTSQLKVTHHDACGFDRFTQSIFKATQSTK